VNLTQRPSLNTEDEALQIQKRIKRPTEALTPAAIQKRRKRSCLTVILVRGLFRKSIFLSMTPPTRLAMRFCAFFPRQTPIS